MLQIYTGDGKGKTTAAAGLALRAAGHGQRVAFIQLMKVDAPEEGEFAMLSALPGVVARRFGKSLLDGDEDPEQEAAAVREGLAEAKRLLAEDEIDVLVLDEANVACALGLIAADELLDVLRAASDATEVIFTGRDAPPEVIEKADLVTEMVVRKHPFSNGVGARQGIDY